MRRIANSRLCPIGKAQRPKEYTYLVCGSVDRPGTLFDCNDFKGRSGLAGWKVYLLATDLSPAVVEKARVGLYSRFEVQRGLHIQSLLKHFKPVDEM